MTAQALSHHGGQTISHRPTVDLLVERAARNMLAWSERRAQKSQLSHERMDLLLDNERAAAPGGSSLAR
jgi:hypothetical protein